MTRDRTTEQVCSFFFLAALCLHCCTWAFSSCSRLGLLSSCCARASHCCDFSCCRVQAPDWLASVTAACGLSCSAACVIFLDQGSNCPCVGRWILNHWTTEVLSECSCSSSFKDTAMPAIKWSPSISHWGMLKDLKSWVLKYINIYQLIHRSSIYPSLLRMATPGKCLLGKIFYHFINQTPLAGTSGKEPSCQSKRLTDSGSVPGSGRSPGGWHGNLLQHSCLENSMDRGAW